MAIKPVRSVPEAEEKGGEREEGREGGKGEKKKTLAGLPGSLWKKKRKEKKKKKKLIFGVVCFYIYESSF